MLLFLLCFELSKMVVCESVRVSLFINMHGNSKQMCVCVYVCSCIVTSSSSCIHLFIFSLCMVFLEATQLIYFYLRKGIEAVVATATATPPAAIACKAWNVCNFFFLKVLFAFNLLVCNRRMRIYIMLLEVPVFCCFCGLIIWISYWMNHSSVSFVFLV